MRAGPLYVAFAATGVAVALPGALLPALMAQWHLGDEQAGRLFLMAFLGSSLGALAVRGSLRQMLMLGSAGVAVASVALGRCGGAGADAWMALYGTGLGLTMTSISLVRQQQAARIGVEMVRLNLLWAFGAFLCPSLTVRALTAGVLQPLLYGLAVFFAAFGVWSGFLKDVRLQAADGPMRRGDGFWRVFRAVPGGLIAMVVLITGIEAAAGGWLATYARRGGHSVAETIAAPTSFWAGLLLSRLLWSFAVKRMAQARVVRFSLGLMAIGSVGLITTDSASLVLGGAFCLGFGIGPTYPLLLAWALQFDRSGAIFFLAGLGASIVPWLTGVVSAGAGSLRIGLAVPMVGTLGMVSLAAFLPLRSFETT